MSTPDPERVQALATRNDAASLIAASAARSAATIIASNKPDAIPHAVRETVEQFAHLLRLAVGDAGTLDLDEDEC